ncbi:MAG: hypothetical protein AVDCRST_MAG03-3208, partial [uncultured Rubrobacteraceae bacterium]
ADDQPARAPRARATDAEDG